jgi:hypothetical protein
MSAGQTQAGRLVRLHLVRDALPVTERHLRRLRLAGKAPWVHATRQGLAVDWAAARQWALLNKGIDLDRRARQALPASLASALSQAEANTKN